MHLRSKTHYAEKFIKETYSYGVFLVQKLLSQAPKQEEKPAEAKDNAQTSTLVKPKIHKDFEQLLNQLDEHPDARKPYQGIDNLLGNGDTFFLPKTGEKAIMHRRELIPYLKPANFVNALTPILSQRLQDHSVTIFDHRDSIKLILQEMILRTLFGIVLSSELRNEIDAVNKAEFVGFQYLATQEFQETQKNYFAWVDKLYLTNKNQILLSLKKHAQIPPNYLISQLLNLIKKQHPDLQNNAAKLDAFISKLSFSQLKIYFQHPDMKALPNILFAISNLVTPIMKLGQKLTEQGYNRNFKKKSAEEKQDLILSILKNIRGMILRYTPSAFTFGETHIPKNSIVRISTDGNANTLFSTGMRKCPAEATIIHPILNAVIDCHYNYIHQALKDMFGMTEQDIERTSALAEERNQFK